ncbi:MAG: Stf0 family sulfotransferase [Waterburya sp.]
MELTQIFQAVEETLFLKQLSSQEKLFFMGDLAPLEYIKNFVAAHKQLDSNYYYDLSAHQLGDLEKITSEIDQYQAIIVVSLEDETALLSAVKEQIKELSELPVLRLFADIFINLLCHRPLLKTVSDQIQKPRISYAIVTTPRSGSTYLCDLLESTKIAGNPSEHLRLAAKELSRHCNFNYLKLLDNLMAYRVTPNGVFGTKLISHFLFDLQQTKPDFKQIFKSVDKFILLVRKDKVAQAVSLVVAQKTEVWHLRNNGNNTNYQSKLENIKINNALLDNVEQKYNFINKQEARLKKVLANNQIEPLTVVYEDILDNADRQINRILDFLAIAKPEPYNIKINSGIKRMPSSISQEIIQQYQQRKKTHCAK